MTGFGAVLSQYLFHQSQECFVFFQSIYTVIMRLALQASSQRCKTPPLVCSYVTSRTTALCSSNFSLHFNCREVKELPSSDIWFSKLSHSLRMQWATTAWIRAKGVGRPWGTRYPNRAVLPSLAQRGSVILGVLWGHRCPLSVLRLAL